MNPSESDHPDLTAYALGELEERDAIRVRQLLARSPAARLEYERIQHAVSALQQSPLIPSLTLSARQRETVFALSQVPVKTGKVVPFKTRPHSAERPDMMWRMTKVAAAAALTAGVFFIGQKSAQFIPAVRVADTAATPGGAQIHSASPAAQQTPASTTRTAVEDPTLKNFEVVVQEASEPPPAMAEAVVEPQIPAELPLTTRPMVAQLPEQATAGVMVAPAGPLIPALKQVTSAKPSRPVSLAGFVETATAPDTVIAFRPGMVKPEPMMFAGVVVASKAPANPKQVNTGHPRRETLPSLIIHSWKAEIASCPWDPNRRLMRFVAQIPVDQDAMDATDAEYRLVAKFDPAQVQGYRLVTEKHMPPSIGGTQATRFAWYEIIPTKNFRASHDKPVAIGTVEIAQPRGASNRNSSTLKLMDRGLNWTEAREDFVFETAMVGFNELLQGMTNTGSLDHKVVLDLAERTTGEDVKGERATFIQTVKQAQIAAGL